MHLERVLIVDHNLELGHSRKLLLDSLGLPVDVAAGVSEVFRLSRKIQYRLVVVNVSKINGRTARIAECIRIRWPKARILLLGDTCGELYDWLYDDIVDPTNNPAGVVSSAQLALTWARTGRPER